MTAQQGHFERDACWCGDLHAAGTEHLTEAQKDARAILANPSAVGAPKGWRWGYLPCGCRNDGRGRHVR